MQDELLLLILKLDLGIRNDDRDVLLNHFISSAKQEIEQMGITLDDTDVSMLLVREYVAWKYRQRANPNSRMPDMVRSTRNNRLFSQKARVDTDV